jgi:hypothetical protein
VACGLTSNLETGRMLSQVLPHYRYGDLVGFIVVEEGSRMALRKQCLGRVNDGPGALPEPTS